MTTFRKALLATALVLTSAPAFATCDKVTFSDVGWTDITATLTAAADQETPGPLPPGPRFPFPDRGVSLFPAHREPGKPPFSRKKRENGGIGNPILE